MSSSTTKEIDPKRKSAYETTFPSLSGSSSSSPPTKNKSTQSSPPQKLWSALENITKELSKIESLKESDINLMGRMSTYAFQRQQPNGKKAKEEMRKTLDALEKKDVEILKELNSTNEKLTTMLQSLTSTNIKGFVKDFSGESEILQTKIFGFADTRAKIKEPVNKRIEKIQNKLLDHAKMEKIQLDAKAVAYYMKNDQLTLEAVEAAIKKKAEKIGANNAELKYLEEKKSAFDSSYKLMNDIHKTNQILGKVVPDLVFLNEFAVQFEGIAAGFNEKLKTCKKEGYLSLVTEFITPAEKLLQTMILSKSTTETKVLIAIKNFNGESTNTNPTPLTPPHQLVAEDIEDDEFLLINSKAPEVTKKIVERKAETPDEKNIELLTTKWAEICIKIDGFSQTVNNMKIKSQLQPHLDYYYKNLTETRDAIRATRVTKKTENEFEMNYKTDKPKIDTILDDVISVVYNGLNVKTRYLGVLDKSKRPLNNEPEVNIESLAAELEKIRNPFSLALINKTIQQHKEKKEKDQKIVYEEVIAKWNNCEILAANAKLELDIRIYMLTTYKGMPTDTSPNAKTWCHDKDPNHTTFYIRYTVPDHTIGVKKIENPFTIVPQK